MSIVKRVEKSTGKPRYTVRINVIDAEGHRRWVNAGTFATKREAEAAESAAKVKRDTGYVTPVKKTTVEKLMESWLASKVGDVSPNTWSDYEASVRNHVVPAFGKYRIERLTPAIIDATYRDWINRSEDDLKRRGPTTIKHAHQRLVSAYDYAARLGMVSNNPARLVKPPRVPRGRFDFWSPDEARAFLSAVDSYYQDWRDREPSRWLLPRVVWDLLLREGLRRGESLGLRWKDIDLDRGTARVAQIVLSDKANKGAALVREGAKTRSSERTIRLTDETVAMLRAYRADWLAQQLKTHRWADTDLIVCTARGEAVNPTNLARTFRQIIATASVEGKPLRAIRIHDLRHSAASIMLSSGIPLGVVSEKLGHESAAITLNVYAHVIEGDQDAIPAAMTRALGSG